MQLISKFVDKTRKDPLVPVGCAATLACLSAGLYAFSKGNANLSQKLMRARVVAQTATVVVFATGTLAVSAMRSEEDARPRHMSKIEYDLLKQAQAEAEARKQEKHVTAVDIEAHIDMDECGLPLPSRDS